MSALGRLVGNASEMDANQAQAEFGRLLAPGERVERAFALIRDHFVFTNWRLILVDKQGVTGKKVEYHSIPYRSITHFAVETAGLFDFDAELKVWVSGMPTPFGKSFNKQVDVYGVQALLATYVARAAGAPAGAAPGGPAPQPRPAAPPAVAAPKK